MIVFQWFRGLLVNAVFLVTICIIFIPILLLAILKLLVPHPAVVRFVSRRADALSSWWIKVNNAQQEKLLPTKLHIEGDFEVSPNNWYMLVANHQCWSDILVIVRTFGVNIPGVKFFFKRSLLWVPILGVTLWGLDFPSMRRYSKETLAKCPELKGRDIEQTRKACERFRTHPVTIINFLEGTRFTPAKHQAQASRYQHLLNPKAGGIGFTLQAMDGQLDHMIDVTILYPDGVPRYWDYVCGRVKRIHVHVRQLPISPDKVGGYTEDDVFRAAFQTWINELWAEKDNQLASMKAQVK
ncbi:MAG: acyltransferase [Cellvibrio sp.]